jgi:uncharacterized Zn-binding protein involved in type VI secretion
MRGRREGTPRGSAANTLSGATATVRGSAAVIRDVKPLNAAQMGRRGGPQPGQPGLGDGRVRGPAIVGVPTTRLAAWPSASRRRKGQAWRAVERPDFTVRVSSSARISGRPAATASSVSAATTAGSIFWSAGTLAAMSVSM